MSSNRKGLKRAKHNGERPSPKQMVLTFGKIGLEKDSKNFLKSRSKSRRNGLGIGNYAGILKSNSCVPEDCGPMPVKFRYKMISKLPFTQGRIKTSSDRIFNI